MRVPNYPCVLVAGLRDETDPEYELRFDADEEYVRELIDQIDEMSLRGVKLCNPCTSSGRPARCSSARDRDIITTSIQIPEER